MGFISWIILGLIAGALAKMILPGKDPGGFIVTIIIGIIGAVIGGYISTVLGFGTVSGFNLGSLVIAILGSIVLLLIYRMVKKPS
ncbi:MAG: GlsB/YeaQ/YmgE family stress response membrane protein [Thermodesulfobacteriota bacterium]